jgi:hypothetical protein
LECQLQSSLHRRMSCSVVVVVVVVVVGVGRCQGVGSMYTHDSCCILTRANRVSDCHCMVLVSPCRYAVLNHLLPTGLPEPPTVVPIKPLTDAYSLCVRACCMGVGGILLCMAWHTGGAKKSNEGSSCCTRRLLSMRCRGMAVPAVLRASTARSTGRGVTMRRMNFG